MAFKKYQKFCFSQNQAELKIYEKKGGKEMSEFSYKWQKSYEFRNNERVSRLKRRPDPHDEKNVNFRQYFEVGHMLYENSEIVNADEKCWQIINGVFFS